MKSRDGQTFDGIALTKGNVGVTAGVFKNASGAKCVADGTLTITWHDGSTEVLTFVAGQIEHIDCASITVTTGTFNIGFD